MYKVNNYRTKAKVFKLVVSHCFAWGGRIVLYCTKANRIQRIGDHPHSHSNITPNDILPALCLCCPKRPIAAHKLPLIAASYFVTGAYTRVASRRAGRVAARQCYNNMAHYSRRFSLSLCTTLTGCVPVSVYRMLSCCACRTLVHVQYASNVWYW